MSHSVAAKVHQTGMFSTTPPNTSPKTDNASECFNQKTELEKICEVISVKSLVALRPLLSGLLEEERSNNAIEEIIPLLEYSMQSPTNLREAVDALSRNFIGHAMTERQQKIYELSIKNIKKTYNKDCKKHILFVDEIGKFGISSTDKFENKAYKKLISKLQTTMVSASNTQIDRWEKKLTSNQLAESRKEKLEEIKNTSANGQIGLFTDIQFKTRFLSWKDNEKATRNCKSSDVLDSQIAGLNEIFTNTEELEFKEYLNQKLNNFQNLPRETDVTQKQKWTIRLSKSKHATLIYFAQILEKPISELTTYLIANSIDYKS